MRERFFPQEKLTPAFELIRPAHHKLIFTFPLSLPPHLPTSLSPAIWKKSAVEIAPLEPVIFFNDTSGPIVTGLTLSEREREKHQTLGAVCMYVCVCVCVCVCALHWHVDRGLSK